VNTRTNAHTDARTRTRLCACAHRNSHRPTLVAQHLSISSRCACCFCWDVLSGCDRSVSLLDAASPPTWVDPSGRAGQSSNNNCGAFPSSRALSPCMSIWNSGTPVPVRTPTHVKGRTPPGLAQRLLTPLLSSANPSVNAHAGSSGTPHFPVPGAGRLCFHGWRKARGCAFGLVWFFLVYLYFLDPAPSAASRLSEMRCTCSVRGHRRRSDVGATRLFVPTKAPTDDEGESHLTFAVPRARQCHDACYHACYHACYRSMHVYAGIGSLDCVEQHRSKGLALAPLSPRLSLSLSLSTPLSLSSSLTLSVSISPSLSHTHRALRYSSPLNT
jgi:hypothetical protein